MQVTAQHLKLTRITGWRRLSGWRCHLRCRMLGRKCLAEIRSAWFRTEGLSLAEICYSSMYSVSVCASANIPDTEYVNNIQGGRCLTVKEPSELLKVRREHFSSDRLNCYCCASQWQKIVTSLIKRYILPEERKLCSFYCGRKDRLSWKLERG